MNTIRNKFLSVILNEYNIDLTVFDRTYLNQSIQRYILKVNLYDIDSFIHFISADQDHFNSFYIYLLNGYSEFFRDPLIYSLLERITIPQYLSNLNGKLLRIWSVGCSTGEEPYSLAIICEEVKKKLKINFDYKIFASDIALNSLDKARMGSFSSSSIKSVPLKYIYRYFKKKDNNYLITSEIKKHINFLEFDIVNSEKDYPPESIFGDFDIVFCSNVLIYYNNNIQRDVIEKLENSVTKTGFLICDSSEKTLYENYSSLKKLSFQTSIFKKREN